MKKDLVFVATVTKIGNSRGVIIPKPIADLLDKERYKFAVVEEAKA